MASFTLRAITPFSSTAPHFPRVADAAQQQVTSPHRNDAAATEIAQQLASPPSAIDTTAPSAADSNVTEALNAILLAAQALAEQLGEVMAQAVVSPETPRENTDAPPPSSAFSVAPTAPQTMRAIQTYEFSALIAAFTVESPVLNFSLEQLSKTLTPSLLSVPMTPPPTNILAPSAFIPKAFEVAPPTPLSVTNGFALFRALGSSTEEGAVPNALNFRVSA